MNKPSFEEMRAAMIDCQLRTTGVTDVRVVQAIAAVPRERFVDPERAMLAYIDEDLPIAPGRFLTEPMVFGRLLASAKIGAHERVLVIGAGTGYGTAVIARLANEVIALEEDAVLATRARGTLASLDVRNARVIEGPLAAGWPKGSPYDVIFIDGAVEVVPQALINQLHENGRLVGVWIDETNVGRGIIGTKAGGGFGINIFAEAAVPKLPGFDRPKQFQF